MKRFAAILLLALAFAQPAAADTLAQQVQAEAGRLLAQVKAAETAARSRPSSKPPAVPPSLVADLQRFGLVASRLSLEIDRAGGPADLRCIFRGMAGETDAQLKAAADAANGTAQAAALSRLGHMLGDAVLIAPAVEGGPSPARAVATAQCPAAEF
jgi:hypothetical protein